MGGSSYKRLVFTSTYYDYEMCFFKREMSVPKRLIDSKAWQVFTSTTITMMGIQDKNAKNSIKSKNYPKSKTSRELAKI